MTTSLCAAFASALAGCGVSAVLLLGPMGYAGAAPVTGASESGAEASPSGAGFNRPAVQISTGNRNFDKLLDTAEAGAMPPVNAASGTGSKGREPGQAASSPGLREASLQQAIRAEAAAQADAKSLKRGSGQGGVLGQVETVLRNDAAEVDPTTRRRWEGPTPPGSSQGGKSDAGEEAAAMQALRELVEYLRTHRLELFSVLGLLAVFGVIFKLYSRRS